MGDLIFIVFLLGLFFMGFIFPEMWNTFHLLLLFIFFILIIIIGLISGSAPDDIEKEAIRRGYAYYNEEKEFVWKEENVKIQE